MFHHSDPPLLLFTDGFCEDKGDVSAGHGAILIDPLDEFAEAFGQYVPEELVEAWRNSGGYDQVVAQAELLPTVVARVLWKTKLCQKKGRRIINFLDNDSARWLLKGYSPTRSSAFLLGAFWALETVAMTCSRFERVPSKSNCADGPSRLDFEGLRRIWHKRIRVVEDTRYLTEICMELLRRQERSG